MLTYIDFCLKIVKIIKEEKIESEKLSLLVNDTIDRLDQKQEPTDTYEEIIAKELLFYRNECQYLNKLRQSLQIQITQLKRQLFEEKEANTQLINVLRQQKQEQIITQNKTEEVNNNTSRSDVFKSNLKQIKEITTPIKATYQLPQAQQQTQMAPHLTIEIKNIKTPFMEYQEPSNLKELFEECVQQIYRESRLRGHIQTKYKQNCNKDHFGHFQLCEENKNFEISKLDIKTLTERFFLNPHFMKMVEAQIFQIKCCTNKACLYNFKQNHLTQDSQITEFNKKELSLPKKLSTFRQDNRSKSVGRSDDLRLQYQWLFAEVLRLEKEISSTPKSNKAKIIELKKQLKETSQQLIELQSKILN